MSRRRGDVGVGGAPLAMLLRLDVELLRLPGPETERTVRTPGFVSVWDRDL